ncbi:hypothetical protein IWW57_001855, partial [Coemansia sp. S610]
MWPDEICILRPEFWERRTSPEEEDVMSFLIVSRKNTFEDVTTFVKEDYKECLIPGTHRIYYYAGKKLVPIDDSEDTYVAESTLPIKYYLVATEEQAE